MRMKLENLKWKDNWAAPQVELRKKLIPFILSLFFCVALVLPWLVGFNCRKGEAVLQCNLNSCHGMGH